MFIDNVTISLIAGRGGNGVVSWHREKYIPKGGPCGGNGGPGGSIIVRADENFRSLDSFRNKRIMRAKNGAEGGSNNKQGRKGADLILTVPCGTLVRDTSGTILADLTEHAQEFHACAGGKGGIGNTFFKTPTNRAPNKCTPGSEGETLDIKLELKLIADVGFLGLPSAGKSTLLNKLGAHKVKTAAYHFTTLHPNLLTLEFDDYSRVRIADIPGIIKDAHEGRGLGLEFLRHIERTSVLIYVIDASGEDPLGDYELLRAELEAYNPELLKKPALIALNKIDLVTAPDFPHETCSISALDGTGMKNFTSRMRELAQANGKRFH